MENFLIVQRKAHNNMFTQTVQDDQIMTDKKINVFFYR